MAFTQGFGIRRNDIIALLLIVLITIVPIPLGSNRPGLWALSDMFVFLIFLAQALMRVFDTDERARFLPRDITPFALFMIVALWQGFQVLPIAGFLPYFGGDLARFGDTISLDPGQSALMLLNYLAYGAVFILAFQIGQRPGRSMRIYGYVAYMVGAFALFSLYNFTALDNQLLGQAREFYSDDAAGTFINRNSFAAFLGIGLVLNVGLVVEALSGGDKNAPRDYQRAITFAVVAAAIFAAILATHSRMGLLSSVVGALTCALLFQLRSGGSMRSRVIGVGIALVGALVLMVLYGQGVTERLGSAQSSFDVRFELFAQTVELILLRPLAGFGAGVFELAFPLVHYFPVSPDVVWDKAHNTYLTLFAELGLVVGTIAILAVAWVGARMTRGIGASSLPRMGTAIGLGVMVQLGLHSFVDFSLEIHAVALLFAFVLGLGLASGEAQR